MKKLFVVCITFFTISFSTFGLAITLDELQKQFSQYPVTRADFVQNRYIQGLAKPLRSTGKMVISQKLGLWWQQKTPFIMTLKMDDKRMEQRIAGQEPQLITAQAQPQLFQFNSLLTAIFNADKQALEKNFTLTLSEKNSQWQLLLEPKIAPLNKIFSSISLIGGQYLSQIVINDKQNDKTVIVFSNHQTTPLTQNEQKLFD